MAHLVVFEVVREPVGWTSRTYAIQLLSMRSYEKIMIYQFNAIVWTLPFLGSFVVSESMRRFVKTSSADYVQMQMKDVNIT